jgi:hypothetical protein
MEMLLWNCKQNKLYRIKCTKGREAYCEIMNVRCNGSLDVLDLLLILLALPKLLAF